jgi:hypothetical protein
MDSQIIDAVTEWDAVSADGGYEGLHRLADGEFSGAVSTGVTWAFVLNGRIIGVFDGDLDDFEDARLTAYRAPDPCLPLLFAMMESGGETRAKYYTNQTPLSNADSTLSAGGFTGYIELSENVLSGDYYVVYHGGKSMSAAFVGTSRRLVTGDEAFELADDEVGIYEVKEVDVTVVELPELDDGEDEESAAGDAAGEAADPGDTAEADGDGDGVRDDAPDGANERDADESSETPVADASAGDETDGEVDSDPTAADGDPTEAEPAAADADESESEPSKPAAAAENRDETGDETRARAAERAKRRAASRSTTAEDDAGSDPFSAEEKWREARSIPSLDPSESSTAAEAKAAPAAAATKPRARSKARSERAQKSGPSARKSDVRDRGSSASDPTAGRGDAAGATRSATEREVETANAAVVEKLTRRLEAVEERREALETERGELEAERDEHRERAEALAARVEALEAEVSRLTAELDARSDGFAAEETMSPMEALSGTNLFVRYDRKGQATLERAHRGEVSRDEVNDNLRLEHHTTFDTDELGVDGDPYEEFLHASTEYGFAKWVVTDLLYEIGETGNRTSLAGLFDAIPEVDRIELRGTVGVQTDEGVEQRDFDVIFRDKMGDALFVADLNTSRTAATQAMVGSLVGNARTVAEGDDALAAAFYVTESFFDPEALEAVADETGGGLLARSKRKSFVKLSRKRGFHLCLVEARNNEFHVNVPDL